MTETTTGIMFDYQEPIDNTLFKLYDKWENDQTKPQAQSKAISMYERKSLTKQLANILDQQ